MRDVTNAFQNNDIAQVNRYIAYGILWFIIYHILWYFLQRKIIFSTMRLQQIIIKKYLPDILSKDHLYRENQWTGKMLTHIKDGINFWSEFNLSFLHKTVGIVINIIWAAYIMNSWWIWYFMWLLIVLIVSTQIWFWFRKKADVFRKQKYDSRADSNRQLVKVIMSRNDIVFNDKSIEQTDKLIDNIEQEYYWGAKQRPYEHIGYHITTGSIDIVRFVILIALWYQLLWWTVWFGDLLASTTIVSLLAKSINDYIEWLREYMKNGIALENFWGIIDTIESIKNYQKWINFLYKKWNIVFDKVSFSYNNTTVIEDCSFSLLWEQKIALVWNSGGWKTTIAKLIAWYLHPNSGSIIIDDQQLPSYMSNNVACSVNLKSYYSHIGYLTQEPSVFDGTIEENLVFWLAYKPSEKDIKYSLEQAQCDFIYMFPEKLHTQIWEKGIKLSGGQRQRLAIARIFLKNPEIIILDEPTSALDSISENEITKAMNNLFKWRTVIIIAHRLQTIKDADHILVVENGTIIGQGDHNYLLQNNSHYKKLVSLQTYTF